MNLLICGNFENGPFGFKVEDPQKQLVSDIKNKVSKTINIPERELLLYFSDSILPDDTPLSQWKEMRSGAAIVVVVKPLRITLQRYNSDIDVKLEISRLTAPRWSTNKLVQFCLNKAGMPNRHGKYIFMVDGNVLEMGNNLSKYKCLQDDFTISVTFVGDFQFQQYGESIYVPICAADSIKQIASFEQATISQRNTCNNTQIKKYQSFHDWYFNVQRVDGSKVTVTLQGSSPVLTPVYELRHQISPNTNIRLTFGTTILEDWDDEGNMMLLYDYPDLLDGATLYQINLTGAIRIRCKTPNPRYQSEANNIMKATVKSEYTRRNLLHNEMTNVMCPGYICIPNPDHFKVHQLYTILKKFYRVGDTGIFELEIRHLPYTLANDPISSFDFVKDQCTLNIDKMTIDDDK